MRLASPFARALAAAACWTVPISPPPSPKPPTLCSYGAFWMSLAIFSTLSAGGVFVATPEKGDRLMLVLWGILVSAARAS